MILVFHYSDCNSIQTVKCISCVVVELPTLLPVNDEESFIFPIGAA